MTEISEWLALPFFLFLAYANLPLRSLSFLLAWHAGARVLGPAPDWAPLFALGLSLPAALLFQRAEIEKRRGIAERLRSYEREADAASTRSQEAQESLGLEERKEEHLASMISTRERGFRALIDILHRAVNPRTSALFLFDPLDESFLLKEVRTSSEDVSARVIHPASGILRAALHERKPVRRVSRTGDIEGLSYYDGPSGVKSVAAVPLLSEGVVVGVLIVDRRESEEFPDEEMETIQEVAGELVRLIDTSEALHAHFRLKEELTSLYAASRSLSLDLRMEDVMRTLLASARRIVPYDLGAVILHDADSGTNRVASVAGEEGEPWVGETFACAPDRGLISWVIRNQMPLSYDDFQSRDGKSPLFHKRWPVVKRFDSVLILPMQVQGEGVGAALFLTERNRGFPRNERKILEVVTNQAAISIRNAAMVARLEALATTDGLTGLTNHRTFQEALASELARSRRHPVSTSLLLVDIDHFKRFNDEYGHPIGDFVLRQVAAVVSGEIRKVDRAARYGGEEFAVILSGTASAGAARMAERIVAAVARSRFQKDRMDLRVTVSVGSATFPDDSTSREELIERADRALYAAKKGGRNRAVSYSLSMAKIDGDAVEKRRIEGVEEEARRRVDRAALPV
jgi:diguanylate cyclase (GGDEF)-like protein